MTNSEGSIVIEAWGGNLPGGAPVYRNEASPTFEDVLSSSTKIDDTVCRVVCGVKGNSVILSPEGLRLSLWGGCP